MIQLTRLNRHTLWVNSDLLKFVENTPDTVITLTGGEKIVVLEDVQTIVDRVIEFRRRLLDGMPVDGSPLSPHPQTADARHLPPGSDQQT